MAMNHRPFPSTTPDSADLCFPQPAEPLKDHQEDMTWSQWMDEMSDRLHRYCVHFDSPESRLEGKHSLRFTLD